MEFRLGACLPNVDQPDGPSFDRLRNMRAQTVGTLWTRARADGGGGTQHRRPVYEQLERELDKPVYDLRVGISNVMSAAEWVAMAATALREVSPTAIAQNRVRLRVLNEVNLPTEGGWSPKLYYDLLSRVEGAVPFDGPLVAAPISLGEPNWRAWLAEFDRLCGDNPPYDRRAVNCYAGNVPEALRFLGRRPVDVTEINTLLVWPGRFRAGWTIDQCRNLAAYGVESAQVFIAGGIPSGAWDPRYILADDEADELGKRPAIAVTPYAPPPKEEPNMRTVLLYRQGNDIPEASIEEIAALLERGGFSGISPKAMDGTSWQAEFDTDPRLAISSIGKVEVQKYLYEQLGYAYEPWIVYRGFDAEAEARAHAAVATVCGTLIVDLEWQYQGFADHGTWADFVHYCDVLRQRSQGATLVFCPDPRQVRDRAYPIEDIAQYFDVVSPQEYWTDFQAAAIPTLEWSSQVDYKGLPQWPMIPGNSESGALAAALSWLKNYFAPLPQATVYVFQRVGLRESNLPVLQSFGAGAAAPIRPPVQEDSDVIKLNPADEAAFRAATDAIWQAAEAGSAILAKYGRPGASAGEWFNQGAKSPVVLAKELCGLNG